MHNTDIISVYEVAHEPIQGMDGCAYTLACIHLHACRHMTAASRQEQPTELLSGRLLPLPYFLFFLGISVFKSCWSLCRSSRERLADACSWDKK